MTTETNPLKAVGPYEGRWYAWVEGELISRVQTTGDMEAPYAPADHTEAQDHWTCPAEPGDDRGRILAELARAGNVVSMSRDEWEREGNRRFGPAKKNWVFRCTACGTETAIEEFLAIDQEGSAGVSCIGRAMQKADKVPDGVEIGEWGDRQPCNWTTGGLFGTLNGGGIVLELGSAGGTDVTAFPFGDPKVVEEPDTEPSGG